MNPSPPVLPLPPLLAKRYRVEESLGRGAIAEVVCAVDQVTGAHVALKIIYPNLRSMAAVADRFTREANLARRISHPHVIHIHGVEESDGFLFLVMEHHPGGDLASLLSKRTTLPVPQLRQLATQVCGALDAAHRAGVIHRDVKPQNILVGPNALDGELDVRLCDFGLARAGDVAGLTTRTTVLGTPEYMAPEIIGGSIADPRADLYSLAVVLYEAATGRLPFQGDSPYQLLRQHLVAEPPLARSICPDLPAGMEAALARALSKEPLDRFPTGQQFLQALESDDVPTPSTALVPAQPSYGKCARCGGTVLPMANTCLDCGQRRLTLVRRSGGVSVLVTGPGAPGDVLNGSSHVAIVRLLDELPEGLADTRKIQKGSPVMPFYLVNNVDRASGQELVDRLHEVGVTAILVDDLRLVPPGVMQKAWKRSGRFFMIVIFTMFSSVGSVISRPSMLPYYLLFIVLILALRGGYDALWTAVRLCSGKRDASSLRSLAESISRLLRKEDRRLLGRILDRLMVIERTGDHSAEISTVAARITSTAQALHALEESNRAGDVIALSRKLGSKETGLPPVWWTSR